MTKQYRKAEELNLPLNDIAQDSPFYNNVWDHLIKSPLLILWHIVALFTIFPIRVLISVVILLPLVLIASIAGRTFKINPESTQHGGIFSKIILLILGKLYRLWLLFGYGLLWISVKGKIRDDIKITVAGPHSTLLYDPIILLNGRNMSVVASAHLINTPLLGTLSKLLEPIYVDRADPIKRKNAVSMMKNRIENWKGGILIFPEGCITNGRTMANFRVGAFIFGKPVQPVLLKVNPAFPCFNIAPGNWSWTGPHGDIICNILAMCQPWVTFNIEYLEPYYPTEQDLANKEIFALNVQKTMAKAADAFPTDYISYDGHCIEKAVWVNNYAHVSGLIGVERIKRETGTASHFIAHEIYNEFMKIANYQYGRKPNWLLPTNYVGHSDHITSKVKVFKRNFRIPYLKFDSILSYFDKTSKNSHFNFEKFKLKFKNPNQIDSVDFCTTMALEYNEFMTKLNLTETSEAVPELNDDTDDLLKDNFIYILVKGNKRKEWNMKVVNSPFHDYQPSGYMMDEKQDTKRASLDRHSSGDQLV